MKKIKGDYSKALQSEVKNQWKAVLKSYPLVAATLLMSSKSYSSVISKELSTAQEISDLMMAQLDVATATRVGVQLSNCFNNFHKNMARAQTGEDVGAAVKGLSNCLRGRKE